MRTSPRRATRRQDRSGRWRVALASLLGLVTLLAGAYAVQLYVSQLALPRDMDGRPVVAAQVPPDEAARADAVAVLDDGARLRVPAAGMDVAMGAVNAVDGVIDPPGFSTAYFVRNYGAHTNSEETASRGTVFVAMHSCSGNARCPGNALIDIAHGTATVPVGADVYLDGLHYRVTGSSAVGKPQIAHDQTFWQNTPGRLVLLTCLQRPGGRTSVDNMVITAELVPDSPSDAAAGR